MHWPGIDPICAPPSVSVCSLLPQTVLIDTRITTLLLSEITMTTTRHEVRDTEEATTTRCVYLFITITAIRLTTTAIINPRHTISTMINIVSYPYIPRVLDSGVCRLPSTTAASECAESDVCTRRIIRYTLSCHAQPTDRHKKKAPLQLLLMQQQHQHRALHTAVASNSSSSDILFFANEQPRPAQLNSTELN